MTKNLKIIESDDNLKLKDSNNKIIAEIFLNDYLSKEDAKSFLNDIKKQINIKQASEIQEKIKKVDEKMQKCNYQLDELYELYDECEDKFEKELIFAEIRSIEILDTIIIDKKD